MRKYNGPDEDEIIYAENWTPSNICLILAYLLEHFEMKLVIPKYGREPEPELVRDPK